MMRNIIPQVAGSAVARLSAVALALTVVSVTPFETRADEAEAKNLLKAMSDYLVAQKSISVAFDTNFVEA